MFETPSRALACAEDIIGAVGRDNESYPEAPDLDVSIGIGHGPLLLVHGQPPVGHEMNLACKLGEDVAGPGEVLVTPAAFGVLDDPRSLVGREVIIVESPSDAAARADSAPGR